MLSEKTKLSLVQYLSLQSSEVIKTLFLKHHLGNPVDAAERVDGLQEIVLSAKHEQLLSFLEEIARTQTYLRDKSLVSYSEFESGRIYDERWDDFVRCLLLDNYRVDGGRILPVDPTVEGAIPLEDDLSKELSSSKLADVDQVLLMMKNSGEAFTRMPPDYNACLSNARVALETLGKAIAKVRQGVSATEEIKWGAALSHLRTSGLITEEEEEGIAGVYRFVSPGAHSPVAPGLSEEEMVRLGRSLIASMCYFLVKRHNGQRQYSENQG